MADPEYRFRLSLLRKEETYRLAGDALVRSGRGGESVLPLADVRDVRIYRSPGLGAFSPGFERCTIRPRRGRKVILSSVHYTGLGKTENRGEQFRPFVEALVRRLGPVNPQAECRVGMPRALWWVWAVLLVLAVIITPLAVILIIVQLSDGKSPGAGAFIAVAILGTIVLGLPSYIRALRRGRSRQIDPLKESPFVEA